MPLLPGRWTGPLAGRGIDISVAPDGSIWLIGSNDEKVDPSYFSLHKWNNNTSRWDNEKDAPPGIRITAGKNGELWMVDAHGHITRRENGVWEDIHGPGALEISVGAEGSFWIVGNEPVGAQSDYKLYRFQRDTRDFYYMEGGAQYVSIAGDGNVWIVNSVGNIAYYRENTYHWMQSGKASKIGAGSMGQIWILGQKDVDGAPGHAGYQPYMYDEVTGQWDPDVDGGKRIAVGPDGQPWMLNAANEIYRRMA